MLWINNAIEEDTVTTHSILYISCKAHGYALREIEGFLTGFRAVCRVILDLKAIFVSA